MERRNPRIDLERTCSAQVRLRGHAGGDSHRRHSRRAAGLDVARVVAHAQAVRRLGVEEPTAEKHAFGVTQLLRGLPFMIRGRDPYCVHTLWSVQALVNFALFWWIFWNFRGR